MTELNEAVRALQDTFWKALKDKDKALFESILAEDFVGRSPRQPDQSRADFITTLTGFPADVLSVGSDNLEVHLFGDVAVVSGLQVSEVRVPGGNEIRDVIAITNIFQYSSNQWQMKLSHAVSLPAG